MIAAIFFLWLDRSAPLPPNAFAVVDNDRGPLSLLFIPFDVSCMFRARFGTPNDQPGFW